MVLPCIIDALIVKVTYAFITETTFVGKYRLLTEFEAEAEGSLKFHGTVKDQRIPDYR